MKASITAGISLLTFLPLFLFAQSESGDFMRSTGKIYVVVAVIIAIFLAIILYLVYLDRKLTKLENKNTDND